MKVRQVRCKPYTPFEVAVPASITGTRRVRKYFATRSEADAYLVRVRTRGFTNAEQRADAGKVTLAECADTWQARHESKARGTFFQIRRVLQSLRDKHGQDAIELLTHRELEVWFAGIGGSIINRRNYYKIASRFFDFCKDWLEVIPRNPFIKISLPEMVHKEPEILSPETMRKCLIAAGSGAPDVFAPKSREDLQLLAHFCLGGFAGLRTSEILNLHWEDILWQKGEIYVRQPKRVKGWRPRYVEILPPLRRHLETAALKSGRIGVGAGMWKLHAARKSMLTAIAMDHWPANCLRHSFKTYHAAHFQDLGKLRLQMGHSDENMTRYAYGTPEVREVAAQWWNL